MPEDGSLIGPKHVALNDTICIIKLVVLTVTWFII
jgi:hypothetical protein